MDDAPGPRRSKRDAQPSSKATAAQAAGPHDAGSASPSVAPVTASVALPHRRSERHAKVVSAAAPDKSGGAPDADSSVALRDRRRTRASASPARGVTSPPPTAPSSPVRSSSRTASAHVIASADNSPALSSTPNRRRRPAGRSSAVAMAAGDRTAAAGTGDRAQQSHSVLGKYSARECTLLCEVILDHVRRNALAADVLERHRSPACIRWDKVAKGMLKTHRLTITARECQMLWKFLAYAEAPEQEDGVASNPAGSSAQGDTEMLPESDEEDIERPIHEIHARQDTQVRKQNQRARLLLFTNGSTLSSPRHGEAVASCKANVGGPGDQGGVNRVTKEGYNASMTKPDASNAPPTTDDATAAASDTAKSTAATNTASGPVAGDAAHPTTVPSLKPTSSVRLYPTYELPPGSLDGWQRPFNAKKMVPLTFVAEKFLKKRAAPVPKAPPATTAVPASMPSTEVKTNAKTVVTASSVGQPSAASTQAVATPSAISSSAPTAPITSVTAANVAVPAPSAATPKTQAMKPTKKRLSADASGPNNTPAGATAKPAKKKKTQPIKPVSTSSSNQPRVPFTPSTTPPPVPSPARTELDFFRLVYARLNDGSGAASPTIEELAQFFQAAAPAIQEECKKLALIDGERFNRECVRRRIWEKAMGAASQSNSPLASSAVAGGTTCTESTATGTGSTNEAAVSTTKQGNGPEGNGVEVSSTPQEGRSAPSSG